MARVESKSELRAKALQRLLENGRVSVPGAAALIRVHPHTMRAMIARGDVRTIQIGQREYISQAEIARIKEGVSLSDLPSGPTMSQLEAESDAVTDYVQGPADIDADDWKTPPEAAPKAD